MNDLLEKLRSESLHTRFGAVKALRKIGPDIVKSVSPLIKSPHENDRTRLSAVEAIEPFWCLIDEDDLIAFSSILTEPHIASLKIEVIKLLQACRCRRALPAIRACLHDHTLDDRIQSWGFDDEGDQISAYASDAISALEQLA